MIQELYLKNIFSNILRWGQNLETRVLQALDSHQRISLTPLNNCVYDENIT